MANKMLFMRVRFIIYNLQYYIVWLILVRLVFSPLFGYFQLCNMKIIKYKNFNIVFYFIRTKAFSLKNNCLLTFKKLT